MHGRRSGQSGFDFLLQPAGFSIGEGWLPYDSSDITSLVGVRVICDTLGCLVKAGHLPEGGDDRQRP